MEDLVRIRSLHDDVPLVTDTGFHPYAKLASGEERSVRWNGYYQILLSEGSIERVAVAAPDAASSPLPPLRSSDRSTRARPASENT